MLRKQDYNYKEKENGTRRSRVDGFKYEDSFHYYYFFKYTFLFFLIESLAKIPLFTG